MHTFLCRQYKLICATCRECKLPANKSTLTNTLNDMVVLMTVMGKAKKGNTARVQSSKNHTSINSMKIGTHSQIHTLVPTIRTDLCNISWIQIAVCHPKQFGQMKQINEHFERHSGANDNGGRKRKQSQGSGFQGSHIHQFQKKLYTPTNEVMSFYAHVLVPTIQTDLCNMS